MAKERERIGIPEIAKMLGVTNNTVRGILLRGAGPKHMVFQPGEGYQNRVYIIYRDDVEAWITKHTHEGT